MAESEIELHDVNSHPNDEIEIITESSDLPTKSCLSEETQATGVLVIQNNAWQSWIPAITFGLILIVTGTYFLFVQFSNWTVDSIISVILIGNGLVLILFARKESSTFDQRQGKLKIRRTTWRGNHVTEYWLLHIKDVTVEAYKDTQGGTDYELYLFLRSGKRLKIQSGHLIGVGSSKKTRAKDQIKEFLDDFNKKYSTKSRASHSEFKQIMKRQLSGIMMDLNDDSM